MKVVAANRRARFDYTTTDTVEAGIVLTGAEVKSCRLGQVSLAGAYVSFVSGVPVVKQMKISPYLPAGKQPDYEPSRDRTLLLRKKEMEKLKNAAEGKSMTVVPLEVRAARHVKLLLGLATGRKKFDKREAIKKREVERDLREGKGKW